MSFPLRPTQCRGFFKRATCVVAFVVSLGFFVAIPGCTGNKEKTLSGKVTLNGQPVGGEITFVCSDDKKLMSPINAADGKYMVINPPPGAFKSILIGTLGTGGPKFTPKEKGVDGVLPGMQKSTATAAAPEKYSRADNGLTYTVTEQAQQVYNIELKE